MLSTLILFGGCTQQGAESDEALAEARGAWVAANNDSLNGGGINGGGINGGGINGGGINGGGINGGGINGGGINGGGINGGGINGGGINGGGINAETANIVSSTFDLKTISSVSVNGVVPPGNALKVMVKKALTHKANPGNGHEIEGVEVTGKLTEGADVVLRFDDAEEFDSIGGGELTRYVVSFTVPGVEGRAYVCGMNNGVPIKAIPITGKWSFAQGVPGGGAKTNDPDLITFACQGFALYKCIDFGYEPWAKEGKTHLDGHHQACVRMLRADYCGDGRSWTVNGTLINLYDHLGIQSDTENWPVEAEWTPNGASCLSHQRIQDLPEHPECAFQRASATCGAPPQWGSTLLVSEAP